MTAWWEHVVAFDVETTGVDVWQDRIVTATLVEIRPGRRPVTQTWLINPGVDIPAGATAVHGITTEHAREHGREPAQALFEVTGKLALALNHGVPAVIFNAAYDCTILDAENTRHGQPTLVERLGGPRNVAPVIDPFVIDKHCDRYRRGKRTLGIQADHYGVTLAGAHSSAGDALAAARLVPVMVRRHDELQAMTPAELHRAQVKWRAEQQKSLRAHFEKQGVDHDGCDGGWPFQARTRQEALV